MDGNLKQEERELIKLVNYFKKRGEVMIIENKLGEEYRQMLETCDKLVEQIGLHARSRDIIHKEREQLRAMVNDNAQCPTCHSAANLKVIGAEKNDKGWTSNKYRCRKCNITFVWNTPNNPWDMIPYVEDFVGRMEAKLDEENADENTRNTTMAALLQMRENISKLKPVVEASDRDWSELEQREVQMADMVKKFRKHLLIEKIKLEE